MFQLKHHTRKGHKTKLFAAVAYALAGLLASGSAYAVTDQEFQDLSKKVDNNQSANQTALVMLTQTLAKKEKDFNDQLKNEKDKLKVILEAKEKEARDFMADINAFKSDTTKYLQGVEGALKYLEDSQDEFETDLADKVSKKEFADGLTEVVKPLKAMGEEIDKKASKQELADGLTAVLKPLEALGKEVDANKEAIADKASKKDLADGLTAVLKPLEALGKEVDKKANKEQVDTNTKDIADINDYLVKQYDSIFGDAPDALENMVLDNDEKLTNHEEKIAANEKAIADNKKAIDDNFAETKENVNKLAEETLKGIKHLNETKADKAAVEENKALIQATAEAVDETGKLLAALAPEVEETKKALNYKADQGYVDGMVKEIAERYDPVLEDLKNNKLDKTELAKVEAAKTEVAAAKEEVKAEVTNLKNSAAQIEKNKTEVARVEKVLEEKAKALDKKAEALEGNVTAVTTLVTNQKTVIDNLENRVNNFSNQINGLNNKVEKLEENFESGMAIQSAHAALFQPYRVGRVNVTAGLGGYKGKTALAVGVGYRFNERFAAKAGVAADTKGKRASYNLGVNFEF